MLLYFPVAAKVSKKLMPSRCKKPFGVRRALYVSIAPLESTLTLNTHLHGTMICHLGTALRGMKSHTFICLHPSISLSAAACHWAACGESIASFQLFGVCSSRR